MGHSMGAAPILRAAPLLQDKGYKVAGVIVLDVVEGESSRERARVVDRACRVVSCAKERAVNL